GYKVTGVQTCALPIFEGEINSANPSGTAQAFLPMGVGWYRKTLTLPQSPHIAVEFDGITTDATVWFDGRKLGERPNGHATVQYKIGRASCRERLYID